MSDLCILRKVKDSISGMRLEKWDSSLLFLAKLTLTFTSINIVSKDYAKKLSSESPSGFFFSLLPQLDQLGKFSSLPFNNNANNWHCNAPGVLTFSVPASLTLALP